MLERVVRSVAVLASLVVLAGWVSFALDTTARASAQSTAAVEALGPAGASGPSRPAAPTGIRAAIDDASRALVSPFAFLVSRADSHWVRRTVPAVLALLVYGFGLSVVARALHQGRT